jgi:hypothetical protein
MTTSLPSSVPQPRRGLAGEWDKFIGPGATTAENGLILAAFLLGLGAIIWRALALGLEWTVWQWAVAVLVGADILAGAVANSTTAAKRWYHRPGHSARDRLLFVALHAVHLALLALAFPELTWTAAAGAYAYLLLAAALTEFAPAYLQRPVAVLLTIAALLLSLYVLPLIPALEWVFPVFYLKLLVAHLTRETAWPVG